MSNNIARLAALVLGIIGGLTGAAQASAKPHNHAFVVRTVSFSMYQPLESAIGETRVTDNDDLHAPSTYSVLGWIEGVTIPNPSPHVEKPLGFLDPLNLFDGECPRAASRTDGLWTEWQRHRRDVVIGKFVPHGQWRFPKFVVNVHNAIPRLGFSPVPNNGPKRPTGDNPRFARVSRLPSSGINVEEGPKIFDKYERLPINFEGAFSEATLVYADFRQDGRENGNDNSGSSRDKPTVLVRITNNPSQYGWPEMIGAAILVMIAVGGSAYLITGGK